MTAMQTQELDIAAIDTGQCHLIEANAGTGKTYAIANLFLRFVLEGQRVRELLVVTFTVAATDELRGRIRKRLAEAREMLATENKPKDTDPFFGGLLERYPAGEARETAIRSLDLALLEINEASIYTIHGFCQQSLADWAFSSGQAFDLEQTDDSALKQQALRDWWRKRVQAPDAESFLQRFPDFDQLTKHVKELLKVPAPELYPAVPTNLQQHIDDSKILLAELASQWKRHRAMARELLLTHTALSRAAKYGFKTEDLEPCLNRLDAQLNRNPPEMPALEQLRCIAPLPEDFKPSGKNKEAFDQEPFQTARSLYAKQLVTEQLQRNHELQQAATHVRERLRETKQRLGQIAFDDMIERLRSALQAPGGKRLAIKLASRYPIILVDEFQDTDSYQYSIFSSIHCAGENHSLILIGDPKQAIYAFRGGDIFTYIQARHEADRHWTLTTNWRSTKGIIEAVNALFRGKNTFTYAEIPYTDSDAPQKSRARPLIVDGHTEIALRVEDLPTNDGKRIGNAKAAEALVHESVAGRIAWLLQPGRARLGADALKPSDIAILVSRHEQGKAVRDALQRRGVRAVTAGNDSIWETTEAEGLRLLLEAALMPRDRQLTRQALAVDFLALPYPQIHAITADDGRWSGWVEMLAETGRRWLDHGFMAGFHGLLEGLADCLGEGDEGGPRTGWLRHAPDPERSLTNLLHLADLLQTASREHPGRERLLTWMRQQTSSKDEDRELRLESDEDLVKIFTIHKSKGLQFPVVFVPYLWTVPTPKGKAVSWHQPVDSGYRLLYAPSGDDQGAIRAAHERLAEDVRKAYVALTRAESHCHLYFGSAGSSAGKTALAWLLSERNTDLDRVPFDASKDTVSPQGLKANPSTEVVEAQHYPSHLRLAPNRSQEDRLVLTPFDRRLRLDWRIGSFSEMTRTVHQASHAPTASGKERFALRYPAGANVGSFLHALLERLDPARDLSDQITGMAPWLFTVHGIGNDPVARDLDGLTGWMHDVLHTPLTEQGPTLAEVETGHALHELEFDLGAGRIEADRLDALLRHGEGSAMPPLSFRAFEGMINGVIDLVFEHEGRYYLADYKSNLLGRNLDDYSPERLEIEIASRRYDVQYLLYSLALHRHLAQRLHDYDCARHFGGAFYLFLRGMTPDSGPASGVYFTRPDTELIQRIDRFITGTACKEGSHI